MSAQDADSTDQDDATGVKVANTGESRLGAASALPVPMRWPPFVAWSEFIPGKSGNALFWGTLVAVGAVFSILFAALAYAEPLGKHHGLPLLLTQDATATACLLIVFYTVRALSLIVPGYRRAYLRCAELGDTLAVARDHEQDLGSQIAALRSERELQLSNTRAKEEELRRERFQVDALSDLIAGAADAFPRLEIVRATMREDYGGKWFLRLRPLEGGSENRPAMPDPGPGNRVLVLSEDDHLPIGLFSIMTILPGGDSLAAPLDDDAIREPDWWERVREDSRTHRLTAVGAIAILTSAGDFQ